MQTTTRTCMHIDLTEHILSIPKRACLNDTKLW